MKRKVEVTSLICGSLLLLNNPSTTIASEISDHNMLIHQSKNLVIKGVQYNIAQFTKFQLYPKNSAVLGDFCWSSTLRTALLLKQLDEQKNNLKILGDHLYKIAIDPNLSVQTKNLKLTEKAKEVENSLRELGFCVNGFTMLPNKLFNPTSKTEDMRAKPENFIQGPAYFMEDACSYQQRMSDAYHAMFQENPDIVTAQEIEYGECDGINFTDILTAVMKNHPDYVYTPPNFSVLSVIATITFFNKLTYKDVSTQHVNKIAYLKFAFKAFNDTDSKVQVHALEHLQTGQTHYIVNFHADYMKSNKLEVYNKLNEILVSTPNIIVAGDFNLILKNKYYFNNAFQNFKGTYTIKETPEPPELGNPTYDGIIFGPAID